MMDKIASEFTASMLKAIKVMAIELSLPQDKTQIVLSLDKNNEAMYRVFNNFRVVKDVKLDDILFLSPVYKIFKGKIAKTLTNCLMNLSLVKGEAVTVFVQESRKAGQVRNMVYLKNSYSEDLTVEGFIAYNKD